MNFGDWVRDRPGFLEKVYLAVHRIFSNLDPVISRLGYHRVERWLRGPEELSKKLIFDCRMCGQCILHATGMTCPMTCPKNLRNGPCGGVRSDGHCEVKPEMPCIWVQSYQRSLKMSTFGSELIDLQPPVNRQLEGRSAWVSMLTGEDRQLPAGWIEVADIELLSE